MGALGFPNLKLITATPRLGRWGMRGLRFLRAQPTSRWVALTEVSAVVGLAALSAQLVWTLAGAPEWPAIGPDTMASPARATARGWQASALTTVDPFHRSGATGQATTIERAPETLLNLQLFGIRAGSGAGGGSAIISGPDNVQDAYTLGQEIMPGVRLERIAPGRVMIRRSGVVESLSLDKQTDSAKSPTLAVTPPVSPPAIEEPWRRIDVGAATLFANIKLANQGGLKGADGVVLLPGADPALLAQVGLKAGDVLVGVNGTPVTDITSLMALTNTLRGAERLSLEIVSEGQRKIHKVAVDQ